MNIFDIMADIPSTKKENVTFYCYSENSLEFNSDYAQDIVIYINSLKQFKD